MALDTSILTNAWARMRANPNMPQTDQDTILATALAQFVASADVIYQTNLTSATGGAVTAVASDISIAKLK